LQYPLVADIKKEIISAYNVLDNDQGCASRAVIIVDKLGLIQYISINTLNIGRNTNEILRILNAIKHSQENPDELCPANWLPGSETLKPNT
jgi:peroxiredoxin 2/4